MPLLREVAEKLSQEEMLRGVIEEIIDRDDLLALLPFARTEGKALVYIRELTNSEGSFLDVNEVVPEGTSDVEEVVTKLRILAGDVDVDKFIDETMSDKNSQLALQIAMKAKGMARTFRRAVVQGNSVTDPKSFDGIEKLVADTGNFFEAGLNGAAISLSMLDELIDKLEGRRPDALMMRTGTLRALKALWRLAGGNTGGMLQIENFGMMPAHDGIPIIINDFIPVKAQGTTANTCSVYALRLNEVDGLHGLYGGASAGIRVEDIGTVQNKDATRTRLKWYCGLALKSTKSLAAVKGITNV
ncbi:major capsid protein [Pseudomonas phage nickie]|uniref:Major capsid protein n=1 Tax=Pseudomonas phage nickie TaxID=2048977 RepID=A0A2H4P701_9CAUD|nr:major capsid protein [Pseudomonas phage nickie]ATW57949.1 major capsid protein [Pseudomonas phage nickie]